MIVRRDNRQKSFVQIADLVEETKKGLCDLANAIFQKALENRKNRTYTANNLEELKKIADEKNGYIRAMWCGDIECELKLKEEADVSSRCIPFGEEGFADTCVCCNRAAKKLVYWGKAY